MSARYQPLVPAGLAFDEGVPVNLQYGDVYHSRSGALAQARHVFLSGNGLPERWRARDAFTICETGFGTGNNFLAAWEAWRSDPQRCRRLHFVSFEGHPFRASDMAALAHRVEEPSVRALAAQLAQAWPLPVPGTHRLDFEEGAVSLTLAFGPVQRMAAQVQACADAFFLDGFAPGRNPDMWSRELFGQLVRMSAAGATAATWCSAVAVRKALSDAGFLVGKVQGFGRKREMTVASLRPNLGRPAPCRIDSDARVAVVGAGFAGAAAVHALALRGIRTVVLDPVLRNGAHAGHCGHLAAAMSPVLSSDDDTRSRLSRAGVLLAGRRWRDLPDEARPLTCGTLEIALDAGDALRKEDALRQLQLPHEWAQWLDEAQAADKAGLSGGHGGIFFPQGRLVRPGPLVHALLSPAECRPVAAASMRHMPDGAWQLLGDDGKEIVTASHVILANAAQAPALLEASGGRALPRLSAIQRLAGQISLLRAGPDEPSPNVILAGNGYWLPADGGTCVAGSTYAEPGEAPGVSVRGHREILEKLSVLSGLTAGALAGRLMPEKGWAGWRAALADHLPAVGRMPGMDGVWLSCGFGSRGLSWAPLAAEIIAADIAAEPMPLERELLRRIAPR